MCQQIPPPCPARRWYNVVSLALSSRFASFSPTLNRSFRVCRSVDSFLTVGLGYTSHALSSCQCRATLLCLCRARWRMSCSRIWRGTARIARDIALIVAGSLLVALFAQIKIPLGFTPVPITGQTFAVLLVGGVARRLARWARAGAIRYRGCFPAVFRGRGVGMVLAIAVGRLHRRIHSRGSAGGFPVPMGLEPPGPGCWLPCYWVTSCSTSRA